MPSVAFAALSAVLGVGASSTPPAVQEPARHLPPEALASGLDSGEVPRGGGASMMTAGGILVGAGTVWAAPWLLLSLSELPAESWRGGDFRLLAVPGIAASATGVALLIAGGLRQGKWEAWAQRERLNPPPTGAGMTSGAVLLLLGGGSLFAFGSMRRADCGKRWQSCGTGSLVAGGVSLAAVAPLLAGGLARSNRFERWRVQPLSAGFVPAAGGGTMQVSGRF